MRAFFGKAVKQAIEAAGLTPEEFAYRALPRFLLDLVNRYLRVKTEGLENLPGKGPCVVIGNHSGYMGFDALMLGHQVFLATNRIPNIIAHKLWFIRPEISVHAQKLGLVPATFDNGLRLLQKKRSLILFPEGEEGNFKPSRYRYRLRKFRRGFVRLALATGAPIIPSVILGAEETHITISQIRWSKELLGVIIPIPLNVLPLPVKWNIKFLKPIELGCDPDKANDVVYVNKLSQRIRHELQHELHDQLRKRETLFF
ncbi:MAG: acyltransferase family protein [Deltaproteobacteria bacterium]|nr:acyltransferase family protein [Deltaproteobacteria bacterium]